MDREQYLNIRNTYIGDDFSTSYYVYVEKGGTHTAQQYIASMGAVISIRNSYIRDLLRYLDSEYGITTVVDLRTNEILTYS